ncbi:MAG: twin-arginine translocase subunit TatC [Desulfurococcales archaeon]|jgi:sec-independent protein translocase protein TatC
MSGGSDEGEEKPLEEHLEELSERLKKILIFFVTTWIIITFVPVDLSHSYIPLVAELSKDMVSYVIPSNITWYGHTYNVTVIYTSPFEGFNVILYTSLLFAALISSPAISYEVYQYVKPALYPHERERLKWGAAAGVGLFALGSILGYFGLAPITMKIMLFLQAAPAPSENFLISMTYSKLLSFIVGITLSTGAVFEIPLVIYYLIIFRVIDPEKLKGQNSRILFIAVLVIAAIITPDPSGITMFMLAIPFYAVLMLGVYLGSWRLKKSSSERN